MSGPKQARESRAPTGSGATSIGTCINPQASIGAVETAASTIEWTDPVGVHERLQSEHIAADERLFGNNPYGGTRADQGTGPLLYRTGFLAGSTVRVYYLDPDLRFVLRHLLLPVRGPGA